MGLSWHRAGRSVSVRAWLNKLNTERAATRRVPGVRDLQTAPVSHGPIVSLRATTLFAVLLLTVSVWVLFVRWAAGDRAAASDAVPEVAATQQPADAPNSPGRDAASAASGVPPYSTVSPTPDSQTKIANNRGRDASRPKQPPAPARAFLVSAGNYTVRSGEHFAEIRVHRSSLLPKDTEFVWWTEAASAKPGIDYVHQSKVTQSFPKGKTATSFFIKLVPGASRTRREVFYVAIAEAGRGASAEPVARAAVWLPMNQEHSQPAVEHEVHADSGFNTAALGSPPPGAK
jgi:hypothetical protein